MAGGPEVLLKSLFRAMGFDPAQFANSVQSFTTDVYSKLAEFDLRMKAQETLLAEAVALLREQRDAIGRSQGSPVRLIAIGHGKPSDDRTGDDQAGVGD